jgi:multidrug efflux pump subunit AcrB
MDLGGALGLALALVYVILVVRFESLRWPLVILLGLPAAALGPALVLRHLNLPVDALVLLGAVVLLGVAVNGSILLVDLAGTAARLRAWPGGAALATGLPGAFKTPGHDHPDHGAGRGTAVSGAGPGGRAEPASGPDRGQRFAHRPYRHLDPGAGPVRPVGRAQGKGRQVRGLTGIHFETAQGGPGGAFVSGPVGPFRGRGRSAGGPFVGALLIRSSPSSTSLPEHGPQEVETLVTRPSGGRAQGDQRLEGHLFVLQGGALLGLSEAGHQGRPGGCGPAGAGQACGGCAGCCPLRPMRPSCSHYNPESRPVAVLGLSGGKSLGEAAQWARDQLVPALRRIDGVADVRLAGDPLPEIRVECDPELLRSLGLSIAQVSRAIRAGHENLPAGDLSVGQRQLAVRTASNLHTARGVADLPVSASLDGRVIRAGEVARVSATFREPSELARLNGKPVVSLAIQRSWGADVGRLWREVQKELSALPRGPGLPKVSLIYSQAEYLEKSLKRLSRIALVAGAAAALVLLFFLRSLGSTLAALLACPFSLLVSCLLMRLLGVKLNLLALSGLALSLGILVDNAVVVIEAVHHHWWAGLKRLEGIKHGVAEVARPVIFSTLTTVAAFLPLLAVSDRVRLYMGSFFWGMSLSLLASLAAALFLVPLLMLFLARPQKAAARQGQSRAFGRLLDHSQRRPWLGLGLAVLFLALAAWQAGGLAFSGGSGLEMRGFRVIAVTKPGTHKLVTDAKLRRLMAQLAVLPGIKNQSSRVWDNQGRVTVTFTDEAMIQGRSILARAQKLAKSDDMVRYHVLPMGGGGGQSSLGLYLFGPDLPGLYRWQAEVTRKLAALPEVKDVIRRLGNPAPQMELRLKHRELASPGTGCAPGGPGRAQSPGRTGGPQAVAGRTGGGGAGKGPCPGPAGRGLLAAGVCERPAMSA